LKYELLVIQDKISSKENDYYIRGSILYFDRIVNKRKHYPPTAYCLDN